jgi:ribosomal-protein-alanine N-acetyltransferase
MSRGDLPVVTAIENASFAVPWPEAAFLEEMRGRHGRCMVLRRARASRGAIAGYICFWILEGELIINNVAIAPAHRRRGLARRLLTHAFDAGRAAGCRMAYLEVRPSNRAALALYAAFGFTVISRRRGYYSDNQEDALVMRAPLKALETR